jgi:adenylate cyclase
MIDRRFRAPVIAGTLATLATLVALALTPERLRTSLRETGFDWLLAGGPARAAPAGANPVVVIDIDRESLAAIGPWPWPRGEMHRLASAVLGAGAAAVVFDVVFAGTDQRSPGSVVRRLADETGNPGLREIAAMLPDGDRAFAEALSGGPVVLAYVLDPRGTALPRTAPVLTRDAPRADGLWSAPGAQAPLPELAAAAAGLGVASLQGDADGVVRRVPLLVRAGAGIAPGLAAEAVRVAAEASGHLVSGPGLRLATGDAGVNLESSGMLRLLPPAVMATPHRISAASLLGTSADTATLKGAIVFVGASAPELGGLRPSLLGPLTPGVSLQAHAAMQMLAGVSPRRIQGAAALEAAGALLAALIAVWLALTLRPLPALVAATALCTGVAAVSLLLAGGDVLLDPAPPLLAGTAAFLASSLAAYAATRRREALLRRRFEQHLAPGVVERIAADPESLRLKGERRRITALFTDIEGFSATAASVSPEELISALDSYFEGVASIIVSHGGMVDKFVGDAVHAFFNMPLDLEGHTNRAIVCAQEIICWTEAQRGHGLAARIGLGRTRIGIETGDAVAGDVGLATKLDYTAHGAAVNTAARLEALNKELGTAICIGPGAAADCTGAALRSLGRVEVRGLGPLEVFTPREA